MDDLVDKFTAGDMLLCVSCRKFLQCPVMLIKKRGNVCATCYDTLRSEPGIEALQNFAINAVLNTLKFPCEYESNGCDERFIGSKRHDHSQTCAYRTVECPLRPTCQWAGGRRELALHFGKDHADKVRTDQEDTFRFPFVAATDANMLKTSMGTFMLYVKVEDEKALFYVYDVDQIPGMKEFKAIVTCLDGAKEVATFACQTLREVMSPVAEAGAEQPLERLAAADHVAVAFRGDDDASMKMAGPMLEILECLVCKNYMRPPIYQCVKGHDICNECRSKIAECPLCQSQYTGTRNYSLEGLVSQMRYPCQYEEQGCSVRALASARHESVCAYRTWSCPVSGCTFNSLYSELLEHVKTQHAAQCYVGRRYNADEDMRFALVNAAKVDGLPHTQTMYIVAYHKLFRLLFTGARDRCTWKVEVIAPQEEDRQYRVMVCVEEANGPLGMSMCGFSECSETVGEYPIIMSTATIADLIHQNADFKYIVMIKKTFEFSDSVFFTISK